MAQPLNLLARDPFKTRDHGYVIRGSVRKLTGSEIPREVILVTALVVQYGTVLFRGLA